MLVVFLRSNDDDKPDAYTTAASKRGFESFNLPLLRTQLSSNALQSLLNNPSKPQQTDAIVATSKRAIESLSNAWSHIGSTLQKSWTQKPFFVVGPSSNQPLEQLGFHPEGSETGNADDLASFIIHHEARPSRILFLRGDKTLDTLTKRLSQHTDRSITVESLVVYETVSESVELVRQSLMDLLSAHQQQTWISFFSPSGVSILLQFRNEWKHKVWIACIGQTTKKALVDVGVEVHAVAQSPNAESLMTAIIEAQIINAN
ncbi:tetrapyrrole biosynthesis, uroporphyrinogen III synthase [Obelidium mucronatum]|nr:tetrapyrrole biosynthesis, uroporphyrinogen III synthase [Obelidium mucronatum]